MAERSLTRVAKDARAGIEELVGCPAEGVTGVARNDDGWVVQVEVLEVARVPETTDVMATYDVDVDPAGDVVGYRRVRRYLRAQVEN